MTSRLIAALVLCASTTLAHGQYYYGPYEPMPPQQYYQASPPAPAHNSRSVLSDRCRQASELIRTNNCGPQGCDAGVCIALQHGCHINTWGHHCPK